MEWLHRLAAAARAAADELQALGDPASHRTLIADLEAFHARLADELAGAKAHDADSSQ
jgi:hypothetical protein